jgi:hypothetical protein
MIPTSNAGRRACGILLAAVLSACSSRVGDLTLVSTKNIDLSDAHLDAKGGKRVKGEDCVIAVLGLFPLGLPNLQGAVDDALNNGNGNVMVDQVSRVSEVYFVLASRRCIEVEGTVLNVSLKK